MINGQRFPKHKMVQDIYSSRTYVRIRRMALMSLHGVSDLSSIMSDYSYGVWFREMMQLMTLIVMMVLMI
jgi:succinate dehydrogenase hydrophobic anchor subunit